MVLYLLHRFLLFLIAIFFLFLISFSLSYLDLSNKFICSSSLFDSLVFYFDRLLHLNFGTSIFNGELISVQLKKNFFATMELCILSFVLSFIIGIPLGIIPVFWKNKFLDIIINVFVLFSFSIPIFMLFLVLPSFFSQYMSFFSIHDRINLLNDLPSVTGFLLVDAWLYDFSDNNMMIKVLKHMTLPILTIAFSSITEIVRLVKNSTENIVNSNYIKVAKARGLSRILIIRYYVLHNAISLIITNLGMQFSTILTLTMITEFIYNWPGLGNLLIFAIQQKDYSIISYIVLLVGSLVIIINVLSDILELIINPFKRKNSYVFR
ncbi:sapB [Candidatus Providencia siddallii]|uniref:SapB protein n=1 Tax=Candidatus Providencia siddallii TaxID=1715285 RepID=A0A0M6W7S2_9GAMM|nr:sapB [Candidatus Providencia siddallii]